MAKLKRVAKRLNFPIKQGADFDLPFVFYNGDAAELNAEGVPHTNGIPDTWTIRPITGYTARCHLREAVDDETTIDILTTENGRISIDGVNGKLTLHFTNAVTKLYDFTTCGYDIELIDTDNKVIDFMYGEIELVLEYTRE